MSRLWVFVLCVWALIYTGLCIGDETNLPEEVLLNPKYHDRIIMVGFTDRHIGRIQISALSAGYRRRGNYRSSSWGRNITSELAEKYHLVKLTEWPMSEIGVHCAVYLLPDDASVTKLMKSIANEQRIEIVQPMHRFKTKAHRYNDPYYQLQTNMHQMRIEQAHNNATGKGVTVAVIDTGVDDRHPDLIGQINISKNFVSSISAGFADDIHGTAVTGVIVARHNNETGIIGVAPDARILALKACWPDEPGSLEATCNSFSLALAINTAIKLGADVLNMSLSGPEDALLALLLKKAQDKGIFIVAADPGMIETEHRFPASLNGVIPVQLFDEEQVDTAFSSPVIKAPGKHILTTFPFGTYDFISGSSFSAAQISGLLALMLELDSELNINEIRRYLLYYRKQGQSSLNSEQIAFLDAEQIIESLCRAASCR